MWDVPDLVGLGDASLEKPAGYATVCEFCKYNQLVAAAAAAALFGMFSDLVDWVRVLLDGDCAVSVGAFSAFVVELFLCCAGGPKTMIRVQVSTVPSGACLRNWDRILNGWTSLMVPRSRRQQLLLVSGHLNADALCEVQFRGAKIHFFLRGFGGNTRVVRCVGSDTIHEAVVYVHGDTYMTLGSNVVDIYDTPLRNGIKSTLPPEIYAVFFFGGS